MFFASYFLVDEKYKNLVILSYSLIFYFFGCFDDISHFLILVFSIIINYFFGISISKSEKLKRKIIFIVSLVFNISVLVYFKYINFIIDIFIKVSKHSISTVNVLLPLGISFYTMQIISYLVDVYKCDVKEERDFINFGAYIVMFPQLIAGPIVRYKSIKEQLLEKKDNLDDKINGIYFFVYGLSSKVILANFLSYVQLDTTNYITDFSSSIAWLSASCFMMQLYFDFYGYSLMAKGLGKIMGIDIIDNFNEPLLAKSITDFWRRWHISLSTFLRDYIYIPLGGGRNGILKTCINLFIVFFISGLWHGANYNYILFGVLFAFFMIIEKLFLYRILVKLNIVSHIYTLAVVFIIFVFFAHENLTECIYYVKNMLFIGEKLFSKGFLEILKINYKSILLAILFVVRIPQIIFNKISINKFIKNILVVVLFVIDLIIIFKGYNDPFMYFRF